MSRLAHASRWNASSASEPRRSRAVVVAIVGAFLIAVASAGCGRLEEHVRHADEAYRNARYGDAEEWLERVEIDVGELPIATQSRFYFVRGMSAYRLGHRDEAFYYLNLGKQTAIRTGGALPPADADVLARTLTELTPTDASYRAAAAPADTSAVAAPE